MATELDHDTIKDAIVDLLQANSSLYTTTAEAGELRSIEAGVPFGDDLSEGMHPFAFVTNSEGVFETVELSGVSSNVAVSLKHTIHYDIIVVVNEKQAKEAEDQLDNFQKLIFQTIEADTSINDNVELAYPVRVSAYRIEKKNTGLRARRLTIRCIVTTG